MTIISLASCTGAPGVTTTAVATAVALTTTDIIEPVMVELAVSGGVVASQYDLPVEPGLTTLALALGDEPPDILDHAQELPGGLPVVMAPASGAKTAKLVEAKADQLAHFLAATPATVLADCGRITADGPHLPVLLQSSLIGILVTPSREAFQLAATAIAGLNELAGTRLPVGWVLVGDCPWSHDDIVGQYRLPVLCQIDTDPIGAQAVAGLRRIRRRSPLARSARSFADDLVKHLRVSSPSAPLSYLPPDLQAGPPVEPVDDAGGSSPAEGSSAVEWGSGRSGTHSADSASDLDTASAVEAEPDLDPAAGAEPEADDAQAADAEPRAVAR